MKQWFPGTSGDESKVIRDVLDRTRRTIRPPPATMDDTRKDLDEARAFVQAKNLLTLPAGSQSAGDPHARVSARHLCGGRIQPGAGAGNRNWAHSSG